MRTGDLQEGLSSLGRRVDSGAREQEMDGRTEARDPVLKRRATRNVKSHPDEEERERG